MPPSDRLDDRGNAGRGPCSTMRRGSAPAEVGSIACVILLALWRCNLEFTIFPGAIGRQGRLR